MKLMSFRIRITEALKKISVEKANNYNQKVNQGQHQQIQKPELKQLLKREFNKKSMLTG
jgi:hypothetical protein